MYYVAEYFEWQIKASTFKAKAMELSWPRIQNENRKMQIQDLKKRTLTYLF